jgi:hypothetical protein
MAKAKKKAAKKKAPKVAKKKTIAKRKPAAAPRRKGAAKKRPVKKSAADGVRLGVSPDLDTRLRLLATKMGKSLEEVLIQALTEFADNWEDHLRTLTVLNQGDDRMQLAVPQDDDGQ